MATAGKLAHHLRWQRTLHGPKTLDQDLGTIGEYVGPRTGPDNCTQGDQEDYVLRRLLAALCVTGRLNYPVTINTETERDGEPDFLLDFGDGPTLGIEVTTAGEEIHQAWLTPTENMTDARASDSRPHAGDIQHFPVVDEFVRVIRKKLSKFEKGEYRTPSACDLAVYNNTAWGGFKDKHPIVDELRRVNDFSGRFSEIHLVFESHVFLNVLGADHWEIDISKLYETDLSAWLVDQAQRLRTGTWPGVDAANPGVDAANIAEELETLGRSEQRALESHLHIRLNACAEMGFSNGTTVPELVCIASGNSLSEMENRIATSASLRRADFLEPLVAKVYPKARAEALEETGLAAIVMPEHCPFEIEAIFDSGFPGLEPEED